MSLLVLGPLDTGADALSPRERVILAALVVRRGKGVAPAELADALWGERPPATWEQQVRNSIARIRSKLGREAVETVGWEYRLAIDPESIDAVRFERLISSARQHALHDEHDRSVDVYRKALALWRGSPLPELAAWEPGTAETARLVELRTSAEEELLDARLRAGEDRAVIPEAEQRVREDPLREDRWAILALANYRANRQADALAVLRAARARLDEELGVEPGPRITELETAILRHDPVLDTPPPAPRESLACPYPGLVPFGPDDAESFFGRDADIDAVQSRLRPNTITTIAGPSGCGKSSLLLAGIVPELRRRGRRVEVMRPGAGGVPGLARLVRPDAGLDVLALDQAEEVLSLVDVDAFCAEVSAFSARGGCVVLTVRSDFLDRMGALPAIGPALGRGIHLLTGLDQVGLRAAIEGPAHQAGLRLEPGLVELVLRDAASRPAVLPHLSHALVETWVRREGLTLTVDGYETAGGIAGAIARSAESSYQALSAEEQEACRSIMLRLIERDSAGASTRRRATAAPLLADPVRRRVVEALIAARLLAMDGDAVIVGHEAVADAWPRLDAWLQDDAEGTRLMSAVATSADVWDAGGRRADDLLRGGRLQSALDWRTASVPDLTSVETEFLDASAEVHQGELVRERRQNRRLRWALSGAAALLVAALVAGGVAIVRGGEATAAAEDQRIEALSATSLLLRDTDRDAAALLAAELQRRAPDDSRVRSALLGSLTAAGGLISRLVYVEGVRSTGTLIPGTRTILVVSDSPAQDGGDTSGRSSMKIIDIDTWAVLKEFDIDLPPLDGPFHRDMLVSADGRVAAVQTGSLATPPDTDTCCVNWQNFIDLTTGEELGGSQLLNLRTSVSMVLSPSGDRLFLNHPFAGTPISIDTHTGVVRSDIPEPPEFYIGKPGELNAISMAADGRLLVADHESVVRYDPDTLLPLSRLAVTPGYSEWFVLDDGRGGLLIGGDLGFARIDATTGSVIWQRAEAECGGVDLTDGGTLLCNDGTGRVVERSLENGERTGREYPNNSDWTQGSMVIPGSGEFISFADRERAAINLWRIDDQPSITTPIAAGMGAADGFGDHAGLIVAATITEDNDLRPNQLWDVAADAPVGEPADAIVWLSDSVVWRANESGESILENVATGRRYAVTAEDEGSADLYLHAGGLGPHAFVVEQHRIIPIDPDTGVQTGTALEFPHVDLRNSGISISELVGADSVAVTWNDPVTSRWNTSVFDLGSGAETARGLLDDQYSVATPDDDLISVNASRLARSNADLSPGIALAKTSVAAKWMQVSSDGRTLLASGFDNSASLYDPLDGRRLGDEIQTGWANPWSWPSAYLSEDGQRMVTNTPDGVLLWNLDPDRMREAACRLAGRELTPLEWSTYFGDEPQTPTCTGVLG